MTLLEMMNQKGMKRAELARQTGIERTLVYRHVAGERKPGVDKMMKYAEVFGMTLDEFVRATNGTATNG